MTCSEFVERFSEVYDGIASEEAVRAADEHLASCSSCRRYRYVLERGAEVLRALPATEVHEDFAPRLQNRLLHVEEDAAIRRHTDSGATALAVLGIAVLLTAVAWAPALRRSAPVVELAPIVVDSPPAAVRTRSLASFSAFASETTAKPLQADLWGDARTLLFQYSRLAQRYGQRSPLAREGFEQDR
ncbi:MAG: zf-HC2 domain-containing protein [Longimicrobiales bacterium]|nr:zf-HC2 domain-containing protein [Longimicrobiales bacterium]